MRASAASSSTTVPLPAATSTPSSSTSLAVRPTGTRALQLSSPPAQHLPELLARLGVAGGAVCDALVALAAVEHDADLCTRDRRAKATYDVVGARVVVVA